MSDRKINPWRMWRTGTEPFTGIKAHPYHRSVGHIGHKDAGE